MRDRHSVSIVESLLSWEWPAGAMSLPVSSYEDLLSRVRDLTLETRRLQQQLTDEPGARDLNHNERVSWDTCTTERSRNSWPATPPRSLPLFSQPTRNPARESHAAASSWTVHGGETRPRRRSKDLISSKEDAMQEAKEEDEKTEPTKTEETRGRMTSSATQTLSSSETAGASRGDDPQDMGSLSSMYHGAWPVERSLWHSGPSSVGGQDAGSVMSFTSSLGSPGMPEPGPVGARRTYSQQQLGPKVEMVYGLLSMLGTHNKEEMSRTLLAMSSSPDSCIAMRQSGCLPLLVQLLHGEEAPSTRQRASRALHNLVHSHPDDKRGRREARVLRLLEQVRDYCDALTEPDMAQSGPLEDEEDPKRHPGPTVAALMKLSFDEEHRHAMCQLGGLHAVAQLIQADHEAHGSSTNDQYCVTLRRYAGMALTNLTFGDGTNKALLCSFRGFMRALVAQLSSPSEDLRQVTASVLRNLSWRADAASKQTLREVGAVTGLMQAAMEAKKESTLKSILSALWNLSAHCSMNKADICAVNGALAFLVDMLTYKAPSQTLAIIENAGGILRNISSHVAVREDYRCILRQHNCLQVLLQQLKSPSLTVVSNACGTLWNLSARCSEDQRTLWDMGAVSMLKSLVNSKHKMISMGSSAALKNLLSARPAGSVGIAEVRNSQGMPVLSVRKQRALEQELDQNLAETCDNIEPSSPKTSPSHRDDKYVFAATERHLERRQRLYQSLNGNYQNSSGRSRVTRSDSRESITSTHSDSVYERLRTAQQHKTNRSLDLSLSDSDQTNGEVKYIKQEPEAADVKDAFTSPDPVSVKEQTCIDDKEKSPDTSSKSTEDHPQFSATSTPFATRTKFQNYMFEDDYQPVDYTLKYSEDRKEGEDSKRFNGQVRSMSVRSTNVYGAYAETDLDNPDQPTNFSLRYAEGEEEEEFISKSSENAYYRGASIHDDSVKTYCTEGTPYQTPLNFSTATSMSDLRETSVSKEENDKSIASSRDEKIKQELPSESSKISEVSSGAMSPEKPTQYCVEGTPVCFSRVSSLSSLHSTEAEGSQAQSTTPPKPTIVTPPQTEVKVEKNVTFGAEETPLMFSRCSSLGSLSSFEQHSIHDDRSSIVSDFSRLTSGMISPSELPDSPTQTEPPSPRQTKAPTEFPSTRLSVPSAAPRNVPPQPAPRVRTEVKPENFGVEQTVAYMEENLPTGYSTATSLSALSIEEEVRSEEGEKQDTEKEKELATVSEEEENDEDDGVLDACISSGMQNSAQRLRTPRSTRFLRARPSAIPTRIPRRLATPPRPAWNDDPCGDTVLTYCTEDTPANISHAGSNSDLSVLSHRESAEGEGESPGERIRTSSTREESDDSSFSGDNEYILAECIQSGMPKAKERHLHPSDGATRKKVTPRKTGHMCSLGHSHASAPRTSYHPRALLNRVQPTLEKSRPQAAKDELRTFATEGTPGGISNSTSLSDLTINSDSTSPSPHRNTSTRLPSDGQCYTPVRYATEDTPAQFSHASSLSSLQIEDEGACGSDFRSRLPVPVDRLERSSDNFPSDGGSWEQDERRQKTASSASEEVVTVLSRTASLSSLSVESLGAEPSASEQALLDQCISLGMPKSKSDLSSGKRKKKMTSAILSEERERSRSLDKREIHAYRLPLRSCSHEDHRMAKNEGTSAAINVAADEASLHDHIEGEETSIALDQNANVPSEKPLSPVKKELESVQDSPEIEVLSESPVNTSEIVNASPAKSPEIEVLQESPIKSPVVEQIQESPIESPFKGEESPKQESPIVSDESPSIAVMAESNSSGKLRTSFERMQNQAVMKMSDTWNEDSPNSISFPSLSGSAPLNSSQEEDKVIISRSMEGLLELEAGRVVMAMAEETSFTDSLLEFVKPPSAMFSSMHSASTSLSGAEGDMVRRVPAVVLRALNGDSHNGHTNGHANGMTNGHATFGNGYSLEHMMMSGSSSCASHLENVKPPPAMDEIDMENSMISVASITSEVAGEVKGSSGESDMFELLRPAAAMAELYARAGGPQSLSENLDNVNPPSTFNEITDCTFESTMEPGTETLDTDTELEPEDLPIDSKTGTPIHSNDSTPKKRRRLTPKQRRQMVKDRYATYTIGDEEVKRPDASKFQLPLNEPKSDVLSKSPKQKRLEEKDRFLTQTITTNAETPVQMTQAKEPEARNIKTAKQKRIEDKERYLTQTIESPITAVSSPERGSELGEEEMAALQRDAGIIASALQDPSESTELLECETLSLVSNDSETQQRDITDDDEPAGPRIVKPKDEENVEDSPKGIRGRRKALYTSPSAVRARGGKVPVPTVKSNIPAVRPTRASALRQRGASPRSTTRTSIPTASPAGTRSSIPSTSSSPGGSPKNRANKIVKPIKAGSKPPNNSPENKDQTGPPKLVKQGTFTKDSTIDPAVKMAAKSRLPVRSPSADTITSAPGFRTQKSLDSDLRSGARAATRLRRDIVQPSPSPKPKTTVKATSKSPAKPRSPLSFRRASSSIKPSFSNHSLQNAEPSMSTKVKTSSTPSLNNTGTKKKEVTSKIASLWKKVEDSRYKQKFQKDTRVWITNGTTETTPTQPPPLVRSNTFEKDEKPKSKLAETLAKLTLQAEEAGLQEPNRRLTNGSLLPTTKSGTKPQSAVVQPFNYNPPANVATTSKPTTNGEPEDPATASVRVTSV